MLRYVSSGPLRRLTGCHFARGPSTHLSAEQPAMIRVERYLPLPARTGHDVEVIEVVARRRRHRVVAARNEHEGAVPDRDDLIEGPVVGSDAPAGEPLPRA